MEHKDVFQSSSNAGFKISLLRDAVEVIREKEQKQQHIKGTENI